MYESYWGLLESPFENVPDPQFLYKSAQHKEALYRLLYGISRRKGCVMLTGEVGCGKTTISRSLISRLPKDNYEIALVENPKVSPTLLLGEIIYQLTGESMKNGKVDLLHHFNRVLFQNMEEEKDSVIIIDEAQMITDRQAFEELRLLLNFQLNNRFLLTLILVGQPELNETLKKIPQFEQRIALKYHLSSLSYEEMVQYIHYRLKKAGLSRTVFTSEALELIFKYSEGIPRKINNLCDMGLLVGWSMKSEYVSEQIINNVLNEKKQW
jgi:general secretion pathway protein A